MLIASIVNSYPPMVNYGAIVLGVAFVGVVIAGGWIAVRELALKR